MDELLRRIREARDDDSLRAVYADQLEERGETSKAEYLRLELAWWPLRHERPRGWSLVLVRESKTRIMSIRTIRELTQLGLKEVKDISDAVLAGVPSTAIRDRSRRELEADVRWFRHHVPDAAIELRLEGRAPLRSEELWERLCTLSGQLERPWLEALTRLTRLVFTRPLDEDARSLLEARLGAEVWASPGFGAGEWREGLERAQADALASELNARWPRLAEVQASRCFFDWPVGLEVRRVE
ncbi:MAG: TIGR02996 domain-containing protein [Myxococcota bacterium]